MNPGAERIQDSTRGRNNGVPAFVPSMWPSPAQFQGGANSQEKAAFRGPSRHARIQGGHGFPSDATGKDLKAALALQQIKET